MGTGAFENWDDGDRRIDMQKVKQGEKKGPV